MTATEVAHTTFHPVSRNPSAPVVEIRADSSLRAAQVAALFSRRAGSDGRTVDEIARSAVKVVTLAGRCRRALEQGKRCDVFIRQLRMIADIYDADVVPLLDLSGCVIAIRFRKGDCFTEWPLMIA